MLCSFVKFATFGLLVFLTSAHFGVAQDILANFAFAIFAAFLEPSFLVYQEANPRLFLLISSMIQKNQN